MIIYKITNKLNGKCYIGQTIRTLQQRWVEHNNMKRLCIALREALKKYGKENFSIEQVASYTNLEDLNNAEEYYINFYNSLSPNGYNLIEGGKNRTPSLETRQKMSSSARGKIHAPITEITRKRLSESKTGQKNPMFNKNTWMKGKHHTEETKHKISVSKKGKKQSLEIREAQSLRQRKPIICITTGKIFNSLKEAAEKLNLRRSSISEVIRGVQKITKGYTFKLLGKNDGI